MSEFESAPADAGLIHSAGARATMIRLPWGALRFAVLLLLFGVCYILTARLSQAQIFQKSFIGLVWVPDALYVSALLLTPRKSWWLVLVFAAVAHVVGMGPLTPTWRMAWQIAAFSSFAIVTAEAIRRLIGVPLRFASRREVAMFMGIAVAMSMLLASISPAVVMSLAGAESLFTPPIAFIRLVLGNVTPLLLVTPAVLAVARFDPALVRAFSTRRRIEVGLIIVSILATSLVALNAEFDLAQFPWRVLLTFPPLIWAAVRLGPAGTAASLLCVAALSLLGAQRHLGPFATNKHIDVVLSLQIFWLVTWAPVMLLAATVREREVAEAALNDQRNQLAHMQRLATVGELSVALAHELRQPMTSILANAQAGLRLLASAPSNVALMREILDDIVQADKQAANVISRLRSLIRGGDPIFEPVAIESVISDALALTRSTVENAQVKVHMEVPTGLPRVLGDQVQLLQVLVNLVINGCESMTDIPAADRALTLYVRRAGLDRLEVSVGDCGVGLPVAEEDRVFEPFFTTKVYGVGLGLSIGRSIAGAHGGRLWAENNQGRRGATFYLELPTAIRLEA